MITKFELYNESLRDKLKGKTDEEIRNELDKLDVFKRIKKVIRSDFDKKFLPSKEEISKELDKLDIFKRIRKVHGYSLDDRFMPSDDDIRNALTR